jgi:hypothetical protein
MLIGSQLAARTEVPSSAAGMPAPITSNPGTTATTSISYDNNGNVTAVGTTTSFTSDTSSIGPGRPRGMA